MAQPQTVPSTWTIEMLEAMPNDGWQYEVVDGKRVRMPPPGYDHGDVGENIAYALSGYVRAHGLGKVVVGETGWDLTRPGEEDDTVQASDLAFVRADRLPPPPPRKGQDLPAHRSRPRRRGGLAKPVRPRRPGRQGPPLDRSWGARGLGCLA